MDYGLTGRSALVMGGSSNLGRACAEALAAEGANLLLVARGIEALEATAAALRDTYGVTVDVHAGDMRAADAVEALRKVVAARSGVDILVLNTGRPPSPMRTVLDEQEPQRWREAFENQLWPVIQVVEAIVPLMVPRGWGRIVAITSASVKQPMDKHALSSTFRTGVTAMLKHLANELASAGITVNCVCPASIHTEALARYYDLAERAATVPMKRLGTLEELAAAVAFFASAQAGFITGVSLPVDGGATGSLV